MSLSLAFWPQFRMQCLRAPKPYFILALILVSSIAICMRLQSLWKIAIFSQPEVGHWPSDIGGTVGPSQQQLGFLFSKTHVAFMYAYRYI